MSELTIKNRDIEVALVGCGELIDQLRDPEGQSHSVKAGDLQVWVHREFDDIRAALKRAEEERDKAVKVAEEGERYRSFLIDIARHLDLLGTDIKDLPAAVADRLKRRPWPVMECPDCDGVGSTGEAPGGKTYSCETCGGNEDSPGRGWVEITNADDLDAARAEIEELRGYKKDATRFQPLAAQAERLLEKVASYGRILDGSIEVQGIAASQDGEDGFSKIEREAAARQLRIARNKFWRVFKDQKPKAVTPESVEGRLDAGHEFSPGYRCARCGIIMQNWIAEGRPTCQPAPSSSAENEGYRLAMKLVEDAIGERWPDAMVVSEKDAGIMTGVERPVIHICFLPGDGLSDAHDAAIMATMDREDETGDIMFMAHSVEVTLEHFPKLERPGCPKHGKQWWVTSHETGERVWLCQQCKDESNG